MDSDFFKTGISVEKVHKAMNSGMTQHEIANAFGLSFVKFCRWYDQQQGDETDKTTLWNLVNLIDHISKTEVLVVQNASKDETNFLPIYIPKKNKVAEKLCQYANRYVQEKGLEPTNSDLWTYMWDRKEECGFEKKYSASGEEVFYLQDTEIDLRGFERRLLTYRQITE